MARAGDTKNAWWRRPRWTLAVAAVLVGATCAAIVATSGDDGAARPDNGPTGIDVSLSHCGQGWTRPHPGTQVFDLRSTMDRATEVYLVEVTSGAVYGEVEGLAPGTSRTLRANLGAGTYRFRCMPDDADAVLGPSVKVAGARHGGSPAAVPVNQHDLIPPTLDYQKWVGGRMDDLVSKVDALREAVDGGDLAAARAAWLPAHLVYERMGAAYGTFGDADQAINGTDAGLPGGVRDPGFTGFHRIEQGLWHGASVAELRPFADRLAKDARDLRDSWSQERMDPADLGLRAHEILENTLQFELTGRTDYGSGSSLATARANLDGTEAVLTRLRPLLSSRYSHLDALDAALKRLGTDLDAEHRDGRWTPLDRLGRADRERINADTGDALERLADIAALCDVRRTS